MGFFQSSFSVSFNFQTHQTQRVTEAAVLINRTDETHVALEEHAADLCL